MYCFPNALNSFPFSMQFLPQALVLSQHHFPTLNLIYCSCCPPPLPSILQSIFHLVNVFLLPTSVAKVWFGTGANPVQTPNRTRSLVQVQQFHWTKLQVWSVVLTSSTVWNRLQNSFQTPNQRIFSEHFIRYLSLQSFEPALKYQTT